MPEEEVLAEVDNGSGVPAEEQAQPANDDKYYWGTRYGQLGYDDRYGFGGMFYDEWPYYNRFRNNDLKSLSNTGERYGDTTKNGYEQAKELTANYDREQWIDERARTTDGYLGPYQEVGSKSGRTETTESRRRIEGTLDDELPYTDYNHLPVASGYKSHEAEFGWNFLPPEKWYPNPPRPPICVTEKRVPTMPVYTDQTTADLKEWHSSRRITPPDLISTDYIGEKLNSGR
jgi:hypothetical protein